MSSNSRSSLVSCPLLLVLLSPDGVDAVAIGVILLSVVLSGAAGYGLNPRISGFLNRLDYNKCTGKVKFSVVTLAKWLGPGCEQARAS